MNNMPVHAPLFTPDLTYGSEDCEAASVLLEADAEGIRGLLDETPFEFLSPHIWIEILVLRSAYGVEPFASGGVIVPARHRRTGRVGGYYAFCYIDTDEGLCLGREPFGYPKKFAEVTLTKADFVVSANMRSKNADISIAVVLDEDWSTQQIPPRYPHLLLQVLPAAESGEILLKRVLARDTSAKSAFVEQRGRGAFTLLPGRSANELDWITGARPIYGAYSRGRFGSALAEVLELVEIGDELLREIGAYQSRPLPRIIPIASEEERRR